MNTSSEVRGIATSALLIGLSACATQASDQGASSATGQADDQLDVQYIRTAFSATLYRSLEFGSYEALGSFPGTEDVVQGKILRFELSPPSPDDLDAGIRSSTILMTIETADVYKGSAQPGEQLEVSLPSAGVDLSELRAAVPGGTDVVVYGATSRSFAEMGLANVLVPVNPQALILGESDGVGVVSPLDQDRDRSVEIADTTPPESEPGDLR